MIDVPCAVALQIPHVGYWEAMYVDGCSEVLDGGDE